MRATHLLIPLATAACFQAPSPTQVQGNNGGASKSSSRRGGSGTGGGSSGRSTSGGSGAGSIGGASSGAGGSSGAQGSSSGSSTSSPSGSSGGAVPDLAYVCAALAVAPLELSCPSGVALASQVIDGTNCVPLPGAVVAALGANGAPLQSASAVADANGAFAFCVPYATPFTVTATATGYLTTYVAEVSLAADGGDQPPMSQIAMVEQNFLAAFGSLVPGGYDPTKGFGVAAIAGTDACLAASTGWTISLSLPDGGAIEDGGYTLMYLAVDKLPDSTLTETTSRGAAVMLNIAFSGYLLMDATNPDAGACPLINAQLGYTGRILVGANFGSFAPFILP